jgi:hypothetical protein
MIGSFSGVQLPCATSMLTVEAGLIAANGGSVGLGVVRFRDDLAKKRSRNGEPRAPSGVAREKSVETWFGGFCLSKGPVAGTAICGTCAFA